METRVRRGVRGGVEIVNMQLTGCIIYYSLPVQGPGSTDRYRQSSLVIETDFIKMTKKKSN